jgi:hypothetical protein
MSIKFNCSHCHKSLKVSHELAGKKAHCPGCKRIITIPTLDPLPADIEELAAAAFTDETKSEAVAAPQPQAAPIKFTCFYCDEAIQVDAELAGKQTPCPECRRIIKVPMPVKEEPRDWRTVAPRGPAAGLRRDEQAGLEGAWGTDIPARSVSSQALIEAQAVPLAEEDEVSWPQRIVRGLVAAAVLLIVVAGVWAVMHVREQNLQKKALKLTQGFIPEGANSPLNNLGAAEIYRAVGEYYLREGKATQARQHFKLAQARLRSEPPSGRPTAEHDALAIDLALTYVDLFGSQEEADKGLRLPWGEAAKEIRPTLQGINAPEARLEALRLVSRKLVRRGQASLAETLAYVLSSDSDRPEMVAVVGLELFRNGQQEDAAALANKALESYSPDKPNRPPVAPALLALLATLNQEKIAAEVLKAPPPREGKNSAPEVRLGYAQGWALLDKWPEAQHLAEAPGFPADQWSTLMALAAIALEQKPAEARKLLESALDIVYKDPQAKAADPWLLLRLARLSYQTGLGERVQPLVSALPDVSFQNRARREKLRAELANRPQEEAEKLTEEVQADTKYPLVLELLARHNARYGNAKAVLETIATWEPEALQAFGYAGVMLGLQDSGN